MNVVDLRAFRAKAASLARSTVLAREDGVRVVLLHLGPGQEIPEHQARGAIAVHCLEGEIAFRAENQAVDLPAGVMLTLPAARPHSLKSTGESLVLVTIAEPSAPQPS
jgi:quercetin dioxygenase-like cupin family protein